MLYTRRAVELSEQINNNGLIIAAWEHLWKLGDASEEASRELTRAYRAGARWSELAAFIESQVEAAEGPNRLPLLRELAEIQLSGIHAPSRASAILQQILNESSDDPIATLQLARVYAKTEDWDALQHLGEQVASHDPKRAIEVQHLIADAFWRAKHSNRALAAYERILELDPGDREAAARKRQFLTEAGDYQKLADLLAQTAQSSSDNTEKVQLLRETAELHENHLDDPRAAAELWQSAASVDGSDLERSAL